MLERTCCPRTREGLRGLFMSEVKMEWETDRQTDLGSAADTILLICDQYGSRNLCKRDLSWKVKL